MNPRSSKPYRLREGERGDRGRKGGKLTVSPCHKRLLLAALGKGAGCRLRSDSQDDDAHGRDAHPGNSSGNPPLGGRPRPGSAPHGMHLKSVVAILALLHARGIPARQLR